MLNEPEVLLFVMQFIHILEWISATKTDSKLYTLSCQFPLKMSQLLYNNFNICPKVLSQI